MRKWKFTENRKIIDTKHSLERYADRYKFDFTLEDIKDMINEVEDEILTDYHDKEGSYGWHSKSTGAGGVIDWRPDYMTPQDKTNHAIVVSLFPVKTFHNFKPGDTKIIVERQVILWAKEQGFKMNESFKQKNLCESYRLGNNVYVSFFEGKIYDFFLDGYILIK